MAVISVREIPESQTSTEENGTKTYTAAFRVVTDDPEDGPKVVRDGLGRNIGSGYVFGNDSDPECTLRSRNPTRERGKGTNTRWVVKCRWTNEEPDDDQNENQDENGDPVTDPEDARKVIETEFIKTREVVESSEFIGVYDADLVLLDPQPDPVGFASGDFVPPCNSAGTPHSPMIERERSYMMLRVTVNVNSWTGQFDDYIDRMNGDTFTLQNSDASGVKWTKTFQPRQLLMLNIRQQDKFYNGVLYFRVTFEMAYKEEGWLDYQLDKGFTQVLKAGDDDGMGGTFSSGDIYAGRSPRFAILDQNGFPVKKPVMLDGGGKKLDPDEPDNAKFLGWDHNDINTYGTLPI